MNVWRDKILGAAVGLVVGLPVLSCVLLAQGAVWHALWVACLIVPSAVVLWARLHPLPVEITIAQWPPDDQPAEDE